MSTTANPVERRSIDPKADDAAAPAQPTAVTTTPASEFAPIVPTDKDMGMARLTLDQGVRTTVIGQLYGMDFEIEDEGFAVRAFFDNYNRRLKVLDYEATDYRAMADRLAWLARENHYDKIFLKAHAHDWQKFLGLGYMLEGILKYFYRGDNAYVLSRFGSIDRVTSPHLIEESLLIETLLKDGPPDPPPPLPEGYSLVSATDEHIPALVTLYREVFSTYPSPLTHPDYIQQTMRRHVVYRAVIDPSGTLVSAASAEIDDKHSNAELTDCATFKTQRGKGLMYSLLGALEGDLRDRGIITGYTLARARSVGMNRVFYRLGYEYSGRLLNNCDIYGEFEDMNVWVKPLRPPSAKRDGANGS
jgi:putative beta-lysine N-acetyltransferase